MAGWEDEESYTRAAPTQQTHVKYLTFFCGPESTKEQSQFPPHGRRAIGNAIGATASVYSVK